MRIVEHMNGTDPRLGEIIAFFRELAEMTPAQLAAAAELDRTQLWRIERGDAQPYGRTLDRLAAALGERLPVPGAPAIRRALTA